MGQPAGSTEIRHALRRAGYFILQGPEEADPSNPQTSLRAAPLIPHAAGRATESPPNVVGGLFGRSHVPVLNQMPDQLRHLVLDTLLSVKAPVADSLFGWAQRPCRVTFAA